MCVCVCVWLSNAYTSASAVQMCLGSLHRVFD